MATPRTDTPLLFGNWREHGQEYKEKGRWEKKNIVIDRRTVTDTLLSRKNRYGNTGETPDAIRDTRWSPLGCH